MEGNKIKITTPAQFAKLVELMEKKAYLAKGYNKGLSKINIKEEWNHIADDLNSIGPPFRSGEGWLKVWGDYKFKLKKKLAHNKAESHATGGGTFKQFILTPVEEAAVNLLEMHALVDHKEPFGLKRARRASPQHSFTDSQIRDINLTIENEQTSTPAKRPKKINTINKNIDKNVTQENEEPCTSQTIIEENEGTSIFKRTRRNNENDKLKLLEEQVELQKDLCLVLKNKLSEIERYTRKTYKIKEEKLKLYKDDLERKEKHRKELLKIRTAELEIKKKRMEIDLLKNDL